MRTAHLVIGIIATLIGLVWIGQGLGYVKGSFMTGAMVWVWVGGGTAVVGVALISLSLRLRLRR